MSSVPSAQSSSLPNQNVSSGISSTEAESLPNQNVSSRVPSTEAESFLQGRDVQYPFATFEVFDRIRPLMCLIESTVGRSTGFLLNQEGTVLTVAHNIPQIDLAGKRVFWRSDVQVNYRANEIPIFPEPCAEMVHDHARVLDLFPLKTGIQSAEVALIPPLPDHIQLREGMRVYFAGYPLEQDSITFHEGSISSISIDQGITRFTIDGTVVPGNSGGPVVIQHEGQLYLAGVITSEVADFSPEDRRIIAILKALKEQDASTEEKGASMAIGGTILSQSGTARKITLLTPKGPEEFLVKDRDAIVLALDLIQRNLSTGIGKAIDIRDYPKLFQQSPQLEMKDVYDFPVGKGKKLISNTVVSTAGGQNTPLLKYLEVRYGEKKGPRGIRVTLCPTLGTGTLVYKFSPNPHTAQGNYNKNQEELYSESAQVLARALLPNPNEPPPESFTFKACQGQYTATLEQ